MINIAKFPQLMYSLPTWGLLEIYLIHCTNDTESNFICNVNIKIKSLLYILMVN